VYYLNSTRADAFKEKSRLTTRAFTGSWLIKGNKIDGVFHAE
jgi:hypothetical protein